jgi:hypothetical protein
MAWRANTTEPPTRLRELSVPEALGVRPNRNARRVILPPPIRAGAGPLSDMFLNDIVAVFNPQVSEFRIREGIREEL